LGRADDAQAYPAAIANVDELIGRLGGAAEEKKKS
jgi:hypothetical protein